MQIVLSGLPGVGKTTIARELARSLAAVVQREYRAWDRPELVIDTASLTVGESVQAVVSGVQAKRSSTIR